MEKGAAEKTKWAPKNLLKPTGNGETTALESTPLLIYYSTNKIT